MLENKKIKVVKKGEAFDAKARKKKVATPRAKAREMVATMTDWVSDLKQRKSEETKAALEMLFAANTRPNES